MRFDTERTSDDDETARAATTGGDDDCSPLDTSSTADDAAADAVAAAVARCFVLFGLERLPQARVVADRTEKDRKRRRHWWQARG